MEPASKRNKIEEPDETESKMAAKSQQTSSSSSSSTSSSSNSKRDEETKLEETSHVELVFGEKLGEKSSFGDAGKCPEEETANPFALLRLDSTVTSKTTNQQQQTVASTSTTAPADLNKGDIGKEDSSGKLDSQASQDVDSGIETFDDTEMASPSKTTQLYTLARLQKLLTQVLGLSSEHTGPSRNPEDLEIPDVLNQLTSMDLENLAQKDEDLADFLQNILMEILFFLKSTDGQNALSAGRSLGADSLSCSPSKERMSFGSFGSAFLRQHSVVFADLHMVDGTAELKLFNYLLACYDRLRTEENKKNLEESEKKLLNQLWLQLLSHTTLLLQGFITGEEKFYLRFRQFYKAGGLADRVIGPRRSIDSETGDLQSTSWRSKSLTCGKRRLKPRNGLNEKTRLLLLRSLLAQSLPYGFLEDLLKYADTDPETFDAIFEPVLGGILRGGNVCSLLNDDYRQPLTLLLEMCDMKSLGTNKRPFCKLLTKRADWCPEPVSKASGREMAKLSYLGPFFSLSVFPEEGNVDVATNYFGNVEDMPQETAQLVYQTIRSNLELLRGDLHKILHAVLVNAETRNDALKFITEVVKRNEKKAQIQVDDTLVATDGFMLNFLSVMYLLSSKVTLDKVNPLYPFHPQARLDLTDITRLKLDSEQTKKFQQELNTNFDVKFPTECFFLTMHAQHLAIMPALNRHGRRMRALNDLKNQLKRLEDTKEQWSKEESSKRARNEAKIIQLKAMIQKLTRSKHCAAAALVDEVLLSRALAFTSQQLGLLMRAISYGKEAELKAARGEAGMMNSSSGVFLPAEASRLFGSYPEFYLEDALDFLVYLQRNGPHVLVDSCPFELPQQILVLICNTHYLNSPFLAAKCVEVLFNICPQVNPSAQGLHTAILNHPFASEKLFKSLMKFYSDVESTGSHTEFFDKFTFRRNVQVIFESLWRNALHRHIMIEQCKDCGPEFVRFVNMLINDTTFLLDESLQALGRIHDAEIQIGNEAEFGQLAREEQRRVQGVLQQDQYSVKSWLQLAHQTVETFGYLTDSVPEPFLTENLGDRLAAMLNYNVKELCGKKCVNLKVKRPEAYGWEPRKLLNQLTDIYLHLSHAHQFAEYIAADERSYSKALFDDMLKRLTQNNIKAISQVERLRDLGEKAEELWKRNQQREQDWGDIPEEFADPLMGTLMMDPVDLPSGHTVDRKIIKRHLLSTQEDPFTRQPMSEDQLVGNTRLKQKIREWMQKQKEKAASK